MRDTLISQFNFIKLILPYWQHCNVATTRPQSYILQSNSGSVINVMWHWKGSIFGNFWKGPSKLHPSSKQEVSFVFPQKKVLLESLALLRINPVITGCFSCSHPAARSSTQWGLTFLRLWIQFIPRLLMNQVSVQIVVDCLFVAFRHKRSLSIFVVEFLWFRISAEKRCRNLSWNVWIFDR